MVVSALLFLLVLDVVWIAYAMIKAPVVEDEEIIPTWKEKTSQS